MADDEIKFTATVTKTPSELHINIPKSVESFLEVSERFNKINYNITMAKQEG
jgi:hypothetical protein